MSFSLVSGIILFFAFTLYRQISLWMPTLELKMWYIREVSISPLIKACVMDVGATLVGLSFGVAVNVTPGAGLVTGTMVLLGTLFLGTANAKLKKMSLTKIKEFANLLVAKPMDDQRLQEHFVNPMSYKGERK